MHRPTKQPLSEPRQIKLRASCDTCFLAKVKCSKARPVCSRCFGCGAVCNYSPSCRAGKPKSGIRKADRYIYVYRESEEVQSYTDQHLRNLSLGKQRSREGGQIWPASKVFALPEGELEGGRTSPAKGSLLSPQKNSVEVDRTRLNGDLLDPFLGWIDPSHSYYTSTYFDHVALQHPDQVADISIKPFVSPRDNQRCPKPFPSLPSGLETSTNIHSSLCASRASTCQCFSVCLQTLQNLYNYEHTSSHLAEDVVYNVYQEAINICSTVLECSTCASDKYSELQAMVLATIISKVISLRQDSWQNCLESSPEQGHQPSVEFENFGFEREDMRLELRGLMRAVKQIEELFVKFRRFPLQTKFEGNLECLSSERGI
jgi:Fungal Zn(2)-Cys(6) binuclear cluster domain